MDIWLQSDLHESMLRTDEPFIYCPDGWPLSYQVTGPEHPADVIIIAGATAVRHRYYSTIAEYLSDDTTTVLTFDYRGFGESAGGRNGIRPSMYDWGRIDLETVIQYVEDRYPAADVHILAHSIGGQLIPLAPASTRLKSAFCVGSQHVWHGHWTGWRRFSVDLLWYVSIPVSTVLFGALPGWAYGGKYPLHPALARDWATAARSEHGFLRYDPNAIWRMNRLTMPMHFVSIADDRIIAPRSSVDALMSHYRSAVTTTEEIVPESRMGHTGYFHRRNAHLWDDIKPFMGI